MKKNVLALIIAMVTVISCVIPALGATKSDWQAIKDIADQVVYNSSYTAPTIAAKLAEMYGYHVVEKFTFERVYVDEVDGEIYRYDMSLVEACDHLVTKEQILAALKALNPLMSDKLTESVFNDFDRYDEWYNPWCIRADENQYAVGIPGYSGGGAYYYFLGYTQEGDTFRFYYGSPEYGEPLDVPSIDYGGKTYYANDYRYKTADGLYADSVDYQGKTYIKTWIEEEEKHGYVALVPLPEYGTAEYEALFEQADRRYHEDSGDERAFKVNGTTYYRYNGGYRALHLPETAAEREELFARATPLTAPYITNNYSERYKYNGGGYYDYYYTLGEEGHEETVLRGRLETPILFVKDAWGEDSADYSAYCGKTYVYYNGGYYALPDDVWGEPLTSFDVYGDTYYYSAEKGWFYSLPRSLDYTDQLPLLPTLESGDETYTLQYASETFYFVVEDGEYLNEAINSGEHTDDVTIVYDGVTYYYYYMSFYSMPDFGEEVVLKLENGKATLISYDRDIKFPSNLSAQFTGSAVAYAIKEGAASVWAKDSGKDLVISSAADFAKFVSVKVDGEIVDPIHYTVESGSTKVTFKESYLKTLSNGTHTFTIVSTDGEANTTLTVQATAASTSQTGQGNSTAVTSPKTGDTEPLWLWSVAIVAALVGTAAIIRYHRKKRAM